MLKKGSKLYSIFTGTCPNCQEENMYLESNPFILLKLLDMKPSCTQCYTKYHIEPSFFFGAMYVNYALGIAFSVAMFIITKVFLNTSLETTLISIIILLIVSLPLSLRLSRNIWINIFIHYKENKYVIEND